MTSFAEEVEYDDGPYMSRREECRSWCRTTFDEVQVLQALNITILIVCIWLIAYSIFGDPVGPYSDPFCLLVLFGATKTVGIIFDIIRIPPSLGMLGMGILLKNVGFIHLTEQYVYITAYLRKLTLLSISLPALFTIDPTFVKKRTFHVIALAVVPSIAHAFIASVLSYYLLNLTFMWSLLLGIIQTAAAAPLVISCLVELEKDGYGNDNGVHTLLTSSMILNALWNLTLFGIVFGALSSPSDEVNQVLPHACVGIAIGIGYGIGSGFVNQYVPDDFDWYVTTLRTLMIAVGALLALFGSIKIGYPGAGVIGWFSMVFIANTRWRNHGWSRHNPVRDNYKVVWRFCEPVSFSLVGMEIIIAELNLRDVLFGFIIIVTSTTCHIGASVIVTKLCRYSTKHSIFIGLAWIGKATIQAGIAPIALDYAREVKERLPEVTIYANTIVTVAVISIIITPTIMKIMLINLGPKLLDKYEAPTQKQLCMSQMVLVSEPDHMYRRETRRTMDIIRASQAAP